MYNFRIFAKNEVGFSDQLENEEAFKVVRPAGIVLFFKVVRPAGIVLYFKVVSQAGIVLYFKVISQRGLIKTICVECTL